MASGDLLSPAILEPQAFGEVATGSVPVGAAASAAHGGFAMVILYFAAHRLR